jgi:hypothetical protein
MNMNQTSSDEGMGLQPDIKLVSLVLCCRRSRIYILKNKLSEFGTSLENLEEERSEILFLKNLNVSWSTY